jgi:hypothetical protein
MLSVALFLFGLGTVNNLYGAVVEWEYTRVKVGTTILARVFGCCANTKTVSSTLTCPTNFG